MRQIVFIFLVFFYHPILSAQDISNFYSVYGFRLPLLKQGQYIISITPRYLNKPYTESQLTQYHLSNYTGSMESKEDLTYRALSISSYAVFGLSNTSTMSAEFMSMPTHTSKMTFDSRYYPSSSYYQLQNGTMNIDENQLMANLVYSCRVSPAVEFSIEASWGKIKKPTSGSINIKQWDGSESYGSQYFGTNGPITNTYDSNILDLNASIVFIGY